MVIQRIEAFCGISYIVILVPSFSNLCSHLTDIQFFSIMLKLDVLSLMKVIFQPQRLLTLQTLLPRVCVPLFVFFFWLLCFLPEENNKNKLTVTKVSFISE